MDAEDASPTKMKDPETGLWFTPQEYQVFAKLRTRTCEHTKVFDSSLLTKTGMDVEVDSVFTSIGWESFWDFTHDLGSETLTLEFFSTLQSSHDGVYFNVFRSDESRPYRNQVLDKGPRLVRPIRKLIVR